MMQTQDRPKVQPQDYVRPLGFGESPSGLAIFCNRTNTNTWYTLDHESQPQELSDPALTGYLTSIEFIPKEFRGKTSHKLRFKMLAHRPCTLEAGSESTFTKGFLSAIASLTPEQLRHRITIEAIPADDDKVLFCSVWWNGQKVFQSWDERTNWRDVARKAMGNVTQIHGD